jgi:hypothetical protein
LLLTILSSIINALNAFTIEPLDELQGLRFEEIGQLKMITKLRSLNFHVNLTTIEVLIDELTVELNLIKQHCESDEKHSNEIDKLNRMLDLKRIELKDILYDLIPMKREMTKRRRKRDFLGFLDASDGRKIEMDLETLRDTANKIIDSHHNLKQGVYDIVTTFVNGTNEELAKRGAISDAKTKVDEIERKVNAIITMLLRERLSGDIITIPEFQVSLQNINASLNHEMEELPYHKIIEYYYNIKMSHVVDNNILKLEMHIPIVERVPRSLHKIIEIPARYNDKLIMTDVEWHYLAINSYDAMMLMSLESCYKTRNSTYYCEAQSPLKLIDSHTDCVTNSFEKRKIDVTLCKTLAAQFSKLTFIRLSDGQYFYYTPTDETLNITCKEQIDKINLEKHTTGILQLESECTAIASKYKLIKTAKYKSDIQPYVKQNILNIYFDIAEVKDNLDKVRSPILNNVYYVENSKLIKDMAATLQDVPKIDKLNFRASFANSEILFYFAIVGLVIFILHLLYKACFCWCNCFRSEKK